jgi:integrase/recombinase XerD
MLATAPYTAYQGGAVAKLRLGDFQLGGQQYVLRFLKKGGNGREIPVRHDLQRYTMANVEATGIGCDGNDTPLLRMGNCRTKKLCELVKWRMNDAGLPSRLLLYSFRVLAITDLLQQGIPLVDVQ